MGKADRCVVFGCNNDRRYPQRMVVKDHVNTLQFFSCPARHSKVWAEHMNQEGLHSLTVNQKVCSNHFVLGRPTEQCPHPVHYMRGYETATKDHSLLDMMTEATPDDNTYIYTRRGSVKRKAAYEKKSHKEKKEIPHDDGDGDNNADVANGDYNAEQNGSKIFDHTYASTQDTDAANLDCCQCVKICNFCKKAYRELQKQNDVLEGEVRQLKEEITTMKESATNTSKQQRQYDIEQIQNSDAKMSLHTGLSFALFMWVFNTVVSKLPYMQYYQGSTSATTKGYQRKKTNKPGPKRLLSAQNELLLVLMKIRLNLVEDFLAHLFCCSTTLVSQILSTWLPLPTLELSPLIYWPAQHEIKLFYPNCFKRYKNVRAIIDCTEVEIQRPSLAKANGQIFSNYKNRPTLKILIACTPAGTVSFLSKSAGGKMSDKDIVNRSNIVEKFDYGDTLLADRGFNVQELFLHKGVTLIIPPFLQKKNQFAESENKRTKSVANARIHVERVIGRVKDFRIMKSPIPLNMRDLFDHITTIVCALVNLQPPIVSLKC